MVSPGLAGPTGTADAANVGSGANNDGSVSTTSTQVVSLGAGGLVMHPDTGVTITSAYSNMVSGQTLSLGGPAVTVTNLVGVSPDAASQTSAANAAGTVSTTTQVVSLGTGGLVIINPTLELQQYLPTAAQCVLLLSTADKRWLSKARL